VPVVKGSVVKGSVVSTVPERLHHAEHVMGTVVSFDVPGDAGAAMASAIRWLHWVDATFSPYRDDSDVSRYGRGELGLTECVPELADVLDQAAVITDRSSGYFTVTPGGRFDPSGYVKGWAIERTAQMLAEAGSDSHCVNGGGDVRCAGSPGLGQPWRIGITDPLRQGTLAVVVAGRDFAVATSGFAERGPHIINPHTGQPATGLASITIAGPSLAVADGYATAAFAMGDGARDWAERLDGYEALAITPGGTTWHTAGFSQYLA